MWFNVDKLLFIPLTPKLASCFYIWHISVTLLFLHCSFASWSRCKNVCFSVLGCNLACRFRDNRREPSSALFAFSSQLQPFVEQQRRLWDVRQKKGNEENLSGTNLHTGQIGFPGILSPVGSVAHQDPLLSRYTPPSRPPCPPPSCSLTSSYSHHKEHTLLSLLISSFRQKVWWWPDHLFSCQTMMSLFISTGWRTVHVASRSRATLSL